MAIRILVQVSNETLRYIMVGPGISLVVQLPEVLQPGRIMNCLPSDRVVYLLIAVIH
jgi:hypothetical protein